MPETEIEVIRALAGAWRRKVAPHVKDNSCILAARLGVQALQSWGIKCREVPIELNVSNQQGWKDRHKPLEQWHPDSWAVGAGRRPKQVWITPDPFQKGYDGHLVILTDEHLIDLTVTQCNRPSKNIVAAGPLIVKLSAMEIIDGYFTTQLLEGVYSCVPDDGNTAYKTSHDWIEAWRRFSRVVYQDMTESLCEPAR